MSRSSPKAASASVRQHRGECRRQRWTQHCRRRSCSRPQSTRCSSSIPTKAIDEVRAAEVRKLAAAGKAPVLKHSRWLLLKRPEHLTDAQEDRLADLLRRNLRTVRAYLLKEDFQRLWGYVSPYWAGRFLDRWCTRAMRSRLDPIKEVARMVRSHRDLILNWFRARGQFSSGVVEGFNGKARVITKRAYGFRTCPALEVALYHALGDLPEPQFTHRFC